MATVSVEEQLFEKIRAMTLDEFTDLITVEYDSSSPADASDDVDVEEDDGSKHTITDISITLNPHP